MLLHSLEDRKILDGQRYGIELAKCDPGRESLEKLANVAGPMKGLKLFGEVFEIFVINRDIIS